MSIFFGEFSKTDRIFRTEVSSFFSSSGSDINLDCHGGLVGLLEAGTSGVVVAPFARDLDFHGRVVGAGLSGVFDSVVAVSAFRTLVDLGR